MSVGPGEVGGGGRTSGTLINSSIPTQGSQTITFLVFDATMSTIVVTITSMNATTFTISVLATTTTATYSSPPTTSPTPTYHDEIPLLHDSIIIASVFGSLTILLICVFALIYCVYKRRKRQRQLDYSPPFTSLAPPRESGLSPLTVRSSTVPLGEPRETSLSMGPGIHETEPAPHHSQGTAQQQSSPDTDSASPAQNVPDILVQASTPAPMENSRGRRRAQSYLYHDILRQETENDAARRYSKLDARGPTGLRPLSELSDITDMDTSQRPSADHERGGRRLTLTRASSGVFPHD